MSDITMDPNRAIAEVVAQDRDSVDYNIGVNLIALLDLKLKRNGRVDTAWGDKTPMGLARTVRRVMEQEEEDA